MSNPYNHFICLNLISAPPYYHPNGFTELDRESIIRSPIYGRIDRCVYWYSGGSWDGEGEAIIEATTGEYYLLDLSHCSCYGPEEAFWVIGNENLFHSLNELEAAINTPGAKVLLQYIKDNPIQKV